MVQCAGCINAGLTGHAFQNPFSYLLVNKEITALYPRSLTHKTNFLILPTQKSKFLSRRNPGSKDLKRELKARYFGQAGK